MRHGRSALVPATFVETVPRVREALAHQGFGILTEIDFAGTMRAKLGVEVDDHLILGACNPRLAHRAVSAQPSVSLLLPCTVVVRAVPQGTLVEMLDPELMAELVADPTVAEVAREAGTLLSAAMAEVAGG